MNTQPVTAPQSIVLGRGDLYSFEAATRREWLVTNGIGGFASGTVGGANTRRYHGLLVAALKPPVGRTVLLASLNISVHYDGATYALGANEYADGTVDPRGYRYLDSFTLEGTTPVWRYVFADACLEQRVFMSHGSNTTYVGLRVVFASAPLAVEIVPLCTYRDYHAQTGGGWSPGTEPVEHGCCIEAFAGAAPYRLLCPQGSFEAGPRWHWRFLHRVERERGLDAHEDLYVPGVFRLQLIHGQEAALIATSEAADPVAIEVATRSLAARNDALVATLPAAWPAWVRRLALSADQFLVRRNDSAGAGSTVIAGYPWFADWGRDTMIALPGLAVATGRAAVAAQVLRTFARHVSEGMLPNRFPDSGEAPEYNTVDATLWYFDAVAACLRATNDEAFAAEIYPVLSDIVAWHRRGTRFGIAVDPTDGLLRAGADGVQLTWMDAKVGERVVTPRTGKAVEINALWINALSVLEWLAAKLGHARDAQALAVERQRASLSFTDRFWCAERGYLYDVVDGPDGETDVSGRRVDPSLRPNQIIALALRPDLLGNDAARSVVDAVARELYTPLGLRSLSPRDPRFAGMYTGGPHERDGVYHQGPVWSWLLGPFARAHYNVYRNRDYALGLLEGLRGHLADACLGSVSEIFDGDPPHHPRGCFAQAWGVAETLRAWLEISGEYAAQQQPNLRKSA